MSEMRSCKEVPITDVLTFIVDNRGKTVPTSDSGFPLIATNCVLNTNLYPVFDKIRYVSQETLHTWFRAELKPNDILFVNKGTPGRVCLVPDPVSFCAAQDMIGLRANPDLVDYRYLLAALRSPAIQRKIQNYHVGIAIPHFKKEDLKNLFVPLPSMSTQRKIGEWYFEISEKIENNNAICAELEAMAKLLYDYWFVQFDFPDENGNPYKSSGGKMVWSEELKREIPEGWAISPLSNITETERGISYTESDLATEGIPLISLASIGRDGRYIPSAIKYFGSQYKENKVLKPYDLVMCNTDMTQERAMIGKCIVVPDIFDGPILSTHHITRIFLQDDALKLYLALTTQTEWFHKYIQGFCSGTNVLGLDMQGFNKYVLLIPPQSILEQFNERIFQQEKMKSNIIVENQELSSLRDFLLPLLMNGQVTFKEADCH